MIYLLYGQPPKVNQQWQSVLRVFELIPSLVRYSENRRKKRSTTFKEEEKRKVPTIITAISPNPLSNILLNETGRSEICNVFFKAY